MHDSLPFAATRVSSCAGDQLYSKRTGRSRPTQHFQPHSTEARQQNSLGRKEQCNWRGTATERTRASITKEEPFCRRLSTLRCCTLWVPDRTGLWQRRRQGPGRGERDRGWATELFRRPPSTGGLPTS